MRPDDGLSAGPSEKNSQRLKPWLLLSLLLSSCSASKAPLPLSSGHGLILKTAVVGDPPLLEGELAEFEVQIANASERFILLGHLAPTDGSAPVSWQQSRKGELELEKATGDYLYRPEKKARTESVFNTGLMAPSETLSLRLRLRLLNFPRGFTLQYHSLKLADLSRNVSFPVDSPKDRRRYRRLSPGEIQTKLIPRSEKDRSSHRTVIFPHWMTASTDQEIIVIDPTFARRSFTLEDAAKKIQLPPGKTRVTFFSTAGAWILQQGDKAWLVGERFVKTVAPAVDPEPFYFALDSRDDSLVGVEFRDETKTLFADDVRLMKEERDGEPRWVTFIPRGKIVDFFNQVGSYGLRLDVASDDTSTRIIVAR